MGRTWGGPGFIRQLAESGRTVPGWTGLRRLGSESFGPGLRLVGRLDHPALQLAPVVVHGGPVDVGRDDQRQAADARRGRERTGDGESVPAPGPPGILER